ncbi:MAG: hypothetical protein ACKVSF_09350 [Alphaproteobacteria bacterium]
MALKAEESSREAAAVTVPFGEILTYAQPVAPAQPPARLKYPPVDGAKQADVLKCEDDAKFKGVTAT